MPNQKNSATDEKPKAPTPVGRQSGSVKTATQTLSVSAGGVKETNSTLTADAKRTKEELAKQPKVSYIIPLTMGEKPGATETCAINGYKLTIKKGVRVEIPLAFAELLDGYLNIQNNIGLDKRVDLKSERDLERLSE